MVDAIIPTSTKDVRDQFSYSITSGKISEARGRVFDKWLEDKLNEARAELIDWLEDQDNHNPNFVWDDARNRHNIPTD